MSINTSHLNRNVSLLSIHKLTLLKLGYLLLLMTTEHWCHLMVEVEGGPGGRGTQTLDDDLRDLRPH